MEENYCCNFKIYDEESIYAEIPLFEEEPWMEQLKESDIQLTDRPGVSKSSEPIKLPIGSDIAGKLMTGKIKQLKCGLTVVETYLGWTLMGEIPKEDGNGIAKHATSMFQKEADISDLWNLDLIGIKDPVAEMSEKDREKQIEENFRQTVTMKMEGRLNNALIS